MITRKHLTRYLKELTSGFKSRRGEIPPDVWQKFLAYMVDYYQRFDKEAQKYADETFDQIEEAVERTVLRLPEGQKKEGLRRKLATVRGERSPVPVIFLDTTVLENVIQHAFGQPLSDRLYETARMLYQTIPELVKKRKLVCPENNFHREILLTGGYQAQKALEIIRSFSEGLSFKHNQSIEDFQIFRALQAFIQGDKPDYRKFWKDVFQKETVQAIMKKSPFVEFEHILALPRTAGAAGGQEEPVEPFSARLRIRYHSTLLNSDQQLQKHSTRHLRDLVRLGMRYQAIRNKEIEQVLDGFWTNQKTDMALAVWNHYGGQPEGLEGLTAFFASDHFRNIPAIEIKQKIWNASQGNHENNSRQTIASADISILASVFPYTDIMILGPRMTAAVRDELGLDAEFDVGIYAIDEYEPIRAALQEPARA